MYSAFAAFIIAIVVSTLLTPLVLHFALRLGAVDEPDDRHPHERVIPRMGGLAVLIAFFAPLL